MKFFYLAFIGIGFLSQIGISGSIANKHYMIIPIQGDIEPALVYLVRRGIKEATEKQVDALILEMDTNGGRVDSTEEIIKILQRFKNQDRLYTYINSKAFSAGAFISAATRQIYMAPGAVIGAATPILATGQEMPKAVEEKITSGVRGLVRAAAEQHGHNTKVFDAMVDRDQGLVIEGKEIVPKGKILTLTAQEAEMTYGNPPRRLLSSGTVSSLDELLKKTGLEQAKRISFEATGFENIARWIVSISPILLLLGIVGVYVEMKTPGFGLPGIVGISCFLVFFFGHMIAGLSGQEPMLLFLLGLILIGVEIFFVQGTVVPGLLGAFLILFSLLWAMVDRYPTDPMLPTLPQLRLPLLNLTLGIGGGIIVAGILARYLPETSLFRRLIVQSVAGSEPIPVGKVGEIGIAQTPLHPAGKVLFNERLEDVVAAGEFIEAGETVCVVAVEGNRVVVERRI